MAELFVTKLTDGHLHAADSPSLDELSGMKIGQVYKVKYTKPRNYKFHKKYFALLTTAYDNQEKYDAFEHFRDAVTMQAGYYETHASLGTGKLIFKPKSISFTKMDESEFSKLYNKTIDIILKYVMPGSTREAIEKIVNFT